MVRRTTTKGLRMTDEPDDAVLSLLRLIQSDLADMRREDGGVLSRIDARLTSIERLQRLKLSEIDRIGRTK
jgi:hypothetical protein